MPQGTIKQTKKSGWFGKSKVETFIVPDEGGDLLLVHERVAAGEAASTGGRALKEGDRVSYEGTQAAWQSNEYALASNVSIVEAAG